MHPFEIDKSSDLPMWVRLRQRIIYLIESGYYQPGDKLPTVRELASEVHVNMNTISRVYLSLATDGYIESTRGRGAFVKGTPVQEANGVSAELQGIVDDCIESCRDLGLSLDDIQGYVTRRIGQLKYREGSPEEGGNVVELDPRIDRRSNA